MPRLIVLENPAGPSKEVEVPEGAELVDIADDHWLPLPFSCRSASCATCHIEVLEGEQMLQPPEQDERTLLELIDAPSNSRLACQVRISGGPGLIRIRPL